MIINQMIINQPNQVNRTIFKLYLAITIHQNLGKDFIVFQLKQIIRKRKRKMFRFYIRSNP